MALCYYGVSDNKRNYTMTHYTIDGFKVYGLNDTPLLSMNIIPRKERSEKTLALIEHYLARSLCLKQKNKEENND